MTERDVLIFGGDLGTADAKAGLLKMMRRPGARDDFEIIYGLDAEAWANAILNDASEDESAQEDSPAHYATRILARLGGARAFIAKNNAVGAAREAAKLGQLLTEARLKFEHEKTWTTGKKQRESSEEGNRIKRDNAASKRRQIVAMYTKVTKDNPGLGADAINERVRGKMSISRSSLDSYLASARREGLLAKGRRRK